MNDEAMKAFARLAEGDLPEFLIKQVAAEHWSRPQNLRFAINDWAINETWRAIVAEFCKLSDEAPQPSGDER